MEIRPETPPDAGAIRDLTARAFEGKSYADGTEAAIPERLRAAGALTLSLVAEESTRIIGHVAVSEVEIEGTPGAWFGLGPLSVDPPRQRQGIGSALMEACVREMRARNAAGIVLIGDPAYYSRFGFQADIGLSYRDVPAAYVQGLGLTKTLPRGELTFHPAFG
ncbi:MAG: N-acetyltransferase [Pseudomonadota bacterium]